MYTIVNLKNQWDAKLSNYLHKKAYSKGPSCQAAAKSRKYILGHEKNIKILKVDIT